MTVGQRVFIAIPINTSIGGDGPKGVVHEGDIIAIGDRGEVVIKNQCGVHSYGGPYSDTKGFSTESEAWRHCAIVLRARGDLVLAAAAECEAKASQ